MLKNNTLNCKLNNFGYHIQDSINFIVNLAQIYYRITVVLVNSLSIVITNTTLSITATAHTSFIINTIAVFIISLPKVFLFFFIMFFKYLLWS